MDSLKIFRQGIYDLSGNLAGYEILSRFDGVKDTRRYLENLSDEERDRFNMSVLSFARGLDCGVDIFVNVNSSFLERNVDLICDVGREGRVVFEIVDDEWRKRNGISKFVKECVKTGEIRFAFDDVNLIQHEVRQILECVKYLDFVKFDVDMLYFRDFVVFLTFLKSVNDRLRFVVEKVESHDDRVLVENILGGVIPDERILIQGYLIHVPEFVAEVRCIFCQEDCVDRKGEIVMVQCFQRRIKSSEK